MTSPAFGSALKLNLSNIVMDILACASLSLLELAVLQPAGEFNGLAAFRRFLVVLVAQYAVLKFYRVVLYPNFFSPLRHLPGPKDHNLLLGQELRKLRADGPASMQLEWMRRWPDAAFIRYVSFAGREVLLANSLDAHRAVVQTHAYDFVKPPLFARLVGEITGTGLLFAEGATHRRERRLLAGPLSVPGVRKLAPVFRAKAAALSDVFARTLAGKPRATIEVLDTFSRSTMDTIGVTVLGVELDELSAAHPLGFRELYGRLLHQGRTGQLLSVVNAFVPIRRLAAPLAANRRFLRATRDLRAMLRDVVERRAAELAAGRFGGGKAESRDLLTYMLEEAQTRRRETGADIWSVDDIIGHLLNFTSAGHESTATTLSWSVYVLATHPAMQDRLRVEIRGLLAAHPEPDHDAIAALPFLHNFVREVLRVYPPSYMAQREAVRDLVLDGVHVPRGTQVDLCIPLAHQHPGVWGSGAAAFDPDRWDALAAAAASPFAFEAFLQGPRACPGRALALALVKAVLVTLVPRWCFVGLRRRRRPGQTEEEEEDDDDNDDAPVKLANPSLTLGPADGLHVRFERV
ncbi:cytochrome P450 [Durotheca rogersii]|uniref:cytochrome P450 n=1 Tax=Durotheca rogersii TaxID=419775 RepID=UPI0022210B67|nr:cytochrome P450 [Durotheca rogersii]KAI5867200.1 cytochrome P450 [Durotheca rogersii]